MCKLFVIYIILIVSFGLSVRAQKAVSKDAKPKIDEDKVKEIAAIREQLNKAFEEDVEKKSAGAQGVIVQPEWTQNGGKTKGSTKVVVNQKKLKDAAAIREEIKAAVDTHTYVKGDSEVNAAEVDHFLGIKFRSKNVLSNMVGATYENAEQEIVGFGLEQEMDGTLPNVVESSALEDDVDIEKLKQLEMSSRRTREILVIREIIEDLSFDLGEDVKAWEHFEHDDAEYFIGLRDEDLLIVQKNGMKYEKSKVISIRAPILQIEAFSHWNTVSKKPDGIILVSVDGKILWFLINSDDVFWEWSLSLPMSGLKHFKIDQKEYLAISSDRSSKSGFSSLSIYQFDLLSKEFWIAQKLQLEDPCSEITFLDTGRDMVLAVVQNNSAAIYTFNPHSEVKDHIKFELKSTIQSEAIQSLSGFRMGGYSYLALGGKNPQILQYVNGKFVPKTIFGQNFGLVEMFLPIPARTYRDDLLLLVQHRVDFESHGLVVLEALVWDGEAFEATLPAPCTIENVTFAYGVSCMLDVQRESGIKGSAVLKRNNEISFIVPRYQAESGLYQLRTELLNKNSELLDLREIYSYLKEWVSEYEDIASDAFKFLEESNQHSAAAADYSNLVSLKTPELDFNGNIGRIFLNEYEWTSEDMEVDLEDLVGAIERLDMELGHDGDIVRNRRELTYDTLDFNNIATEELVFRFLNGEQFFLNDFDLMFPGVMSFESLKVSDEVRLSPARLVRDDFIELDNDLNFEEINGVLWKDLISDVVFRDKPLEIDELQVNGEVIVEGDMNVATLNSIVFPDNYLWSSGPPFSIIQAEKKFFGKLVANAVDTADEINGANPFEAVTLSENQTITELITFAQLEVSERMEVKGTVQSKGLGDLISNPTLLDSNIIQSACTFDHLEVRGPILISDKFDGKDLDTILSDIVYRNDSKDGQISIKSAKTFNSVAFDLDLKLTGNSLSGTPLHKFVTKDSEQKLDLKSISGNVYFNNVTVTELYDSIDVKLLIEESMFIDEDGFLDAEIEFEDDVWAETVDITEFLNNKNSFISLRAEFLFVEMKEVFFEKVASKAVTSECDISGSGTLNNVKVGGTAGESAKIYAEEMILENGLLVQSLHGINAEFLMSFLSKIDNIPAMILDGKIIMNHIVVNGDVQVNKLNDQHFDEDIQMTAIWLIRSNYLRTNLKFQNSLAIAGDLKLNGTLNSLDCSLLLQDIVFKSDNPAVVLTAKHFLAGFNVLGNADIESVNKLPFTEIATKQTMEQFQGMIYIDGDLVVQNLEVFGVLNDFPIGSFSKSYRYNDDLMSPVLVDEVTFEGNINLENLHVHGRLNSIANLNEFFEDIVYKNNICMLKGKTTFTGNVTIEKGAYIRHLNGYNVVQLMKNIVFITSPEPIVISAAVSFKDVVHAKGVTIKGSLNATNLMGCPVREWLSDTVRVDKPADIDGLVNFAAGALDGNSLHSIYLNGIDMDFVVTLSTPQNMSRHLSFSSVYLLNAINTSGLVNGVHIQNEMENTLMVTGNQHITSSLTIDTCSVLHSLTLNNLFNNGRDFRYVAKLHGNLNFHSPMVFSKATVGNVITSDLVSGIDFNHWYRHCLSRKPQRNMVVTGNWTVKNLYVQSPVDRSHIGSGHMKLPNDWMQQKYDQVFELYTGMCKKTNGLLAKAQGRVYLPKYIEKSLTLEDTRDITGAFTVVSENRIYLITNLVCESKIYLWDIESESLKLINKFDSGVIEEVIAVPSKNNTVYLVINGDNDEYECTYGGVNVWHFDDAEMLYVKSFNDADISTIYHPPQGVETFYAIDEKIGKVLQLNPNSTEKQSWNLPPTDRGLYRFLPHDADLGTALSNGQQILLLNQASRRFRTKRDSLLHHQAEQEFENRTRVRPTGHDLSFSDFRHVIEKMLRDLIRRLNTQIADINFTLSEGDFDDEHLHTDFMDILDEIQKQKILPPETLTDLNMDLKEFSFNPVQILAARVIQVVWPVLGEVDEVHSHLRNDEHDHPVCSGIFKLLRSAVRDILLIGKFSERNQADSGEAYDMTKIISRIQEFQKEILVTIDNLQEKLEGFEQIVNTPRSSVEAPVQYLLLNPASLNPLEEPFIGQAIPERNLLAADSPYLPARGAGEIVALKTGAPGRMRTLVAVTEVRDHLVAEEKDSIKIFFDVITGSLFQTLLANKPSSLTAFRIQDESLLAFVEANEVVRILIYKGIRGFVDFTKFEVGEEISELDFVSMPPKVEFGCERNFLFVNCGKKLDFYEVVMSGDCSLEGKMECNLSENR